MNKSILRGLAAAAMLLSAPTFGSAECIEDPREVRLDQDTSVRLRSYLCRTDSAQGDAQLKIEFFRLSDNATSLIVAKQPSQLLKRTFGSFKLVETDVAKIYSDLLKRFGYLRNLKQPGGEISTEFRLGPGRMATDADPRLQDSLSQKTVRVLIDAWNRELPYPAHEELVTLQRKQIPDGMHLYYSVNRCDDAPDQAKKDACEKFDANAVTMNLWRSMRSSDVKNFAKNLAAYNRMLGQESVLSHLVKKISTEFLLLDHVARGEWPEDFVVLKGDNASDGCISSSTWMFNYIMREIFTDMVLIENVSSRPVSITGLIGEKSEKTVLRPADLLPASGNNLLAISEKLGPRERLLVPLRISFVAPDRREISVAPPAFPYPRTASRLYQQLGKSGYSGAASFMAPEFRDYVYGPELKITGIVADGTRVDLMPGSANLVDVTISSGSGSCPYLLSWDAQADDWADHGKVLHKARSQALEYAETGVFAGLKKRFRLEEREPEIAYIDHAELAVLLRSGDVVLLKPDNEKLATRDGAYLKLIWGEVVEFSFDLPLGLNEEDVIESRLTLTGYYDRYSSLIALYQAEGRPVGRRDGNSGKSVLLPPLFCPVQFSPDVMGIYKATRQNR